MSKDSREELKPCPFCGNTHIIFYTAKGVWYVACSSATCVLTNPVQCINKEHLIRRWNTRELTIDSGADVCEWEMMSYDEAYSDCEENHYFDIQEVQAFKYCPYCGKKIEIKGE